MKNRGEGLAWLEEIRRSICTRNTKTSDPQSRIVLQLLAILTMVLPLLMPQTSAASRLDGDWIGWAYLDEGGDFPLRLHVLSSEEDLHISLDFPHLRMYGVALDSFHIDGPRLSLFHRNSEAELWHFKGRIQARTIAGTIEIEDIPFAEFEIQRSSIALPSVDPASYADAAGTYRFESGRVIVLSQRDWGELLYRDLGTGGIATLLPISVERFVLGPALYVPNPVQAHLTLLRNTSSQVQGLTWQEGEFPAELAIKTPVLEESVTFSNADVTLAGTLLRPSGAGPHPAAILLGDSDWTTRNMLRRDAEILSAMGLATLIYDRRGFGDSSGERIVGFRESAEDALAAVRYLQDRVDIKAHQIGLCGRGQGGWLAPLAASRTREVAYLLLFVPPAVSPAELAHTRRLHAMQKAGAKRAELQQADDYLGLQWHYARTGQGWHEYAAARAQMDSLGWLGLLEGPATPDPEAWRWARLNMHYDPRPVLAMVKAPVMAFFGGADTEVVADLNKPIMEAALSKGENADFTLVVVPRADHGLNPVSDLRLHRQTHAASGVWSMVQNWLEAHVTPVANISRRQDYSSR